MAVTFKAATNSAYLSGGSGTFTMPAHAVGDLLVVVGFSSSAAPSAGGTVPTWNTYATNGTMTVYFTFATANNHTSGTWTGYIYSCTSYSGANNSDPIGGIAFGAGATQPSAPSITLGDTSGSSQIQHTFAVFLISGSSTWSAAPGGYTARASLDPTSGSYGIRTITKDTTSSDGAVTNNMSSVPYAYYSVSIEITSLEPTRLLLFKNATTDAVTTNNTTTSNFTHNGGFGANMLALVVITGNAGDLRNALAATYGGQSMTKQVALLGNGSSQSSNLVIYTLLNAPQGSQTVNVTCSIGTNIHKVHALTYSNVSSIGAINTSTGNGTSQSISASSINPISDVFAAFVTHTTSATAYSTFNSGSPRVNYIGDSSLGNRCITIIGESSGTGASVTTSASNTAGNENAAASFELLGIANNSLFFPMM